MWKLNKAELGKIFLRPAVYILITVLTFALIVTAFCFNPVKRNSNLTTYGTGTATVAEAFSAFKTDTGLGKTYLDTGLENARNNIETFATSISAFTTISTNLNTINSSLTEQGEFSVLDTLNAFSNSNSSANKSNLITALQRVRSTASTSYNFLSFELDSSNLDFYLTKNNHEALKNYFKFYLGIPNNQYITTLTDAELIALADKVKSENVPTREIGIMNGVTRIEISTEKRDEIIEKYFTPFAYELGSTSILTQIFTEINDYAILHSTESGAESKLELNKLITQYKNASLIATNLLNDTFTLEKSGGLNNVSLAGYIGFETFNTYKISENLAINKYLLENENYTGDYCINFNFGVTSGYEPNAYDFMVYALQILTIIITVFALFFAVSTTAGDFSNGTMKMLATRPLTRDAIVSGKFLACVNFAIIFLIFSALASLIVGFSLYGINSPNVLAVFNGETVVSLPPYVMMLIYLASSILNIVFYLALAFVLAFATRSTTLSMLISFVLLFFGILSNAIFSTASWLLFTPFAHLDLFKYFGGGNITSSLFGLNLTIGGNFILSFLVLTLSIIVLIFVSKMIFKHRDIA